MAYDDEERVYAQRPIKAQLKRDAMADKALIMRIIGLGESLFKALNIDDDLRTALADAKRFKGSALKRQVLYLVGQMRHQDTEAIRTQIDELERPAIEDIRVFHQLENWRDALLAGDQKVFDTLFETFENLDIQHLRQLVRNAHKEKRNNKPPKSARLIFNYLKALQKSD